ncbi:hypothetical protein W04_2579 [Pseudoalteromonas sp. SW0106-04]|uniref:hypothetical protein n=1 Tax=Pseudoalteromonas sp. SW0106-04 TaxID=1702169 RepID=UPI0006B4793D|nr:hypothetical protein [Pseudoalteromonas sp. SW0106-04]GAP76036.1 hypothetical protein W04_2579 [Pseudoalteromonas sp. SW0106-04]
MAHFSSTSNHSKPITSVSIPENGSRRLHLVGLKARLSGEIKLESNNTNLKAIVKSAPFDGPKGIWVIDIKCSQATQAAKLKVWYRGIEQAVLTVNIVQQKVYVLPPENNDKGLLVRLFLVESLNPSKGNLYNSSDVFKSMLWMGCTIRNRKEHKNPSIFGIKLRAGESNYSYSDVVKAKNQFHGFEKYPSLYIDIKTNLATIYSIANNYSHPKQDIYRIFIDNAEKAALMTINNTFTDPCKTGIYGWRTRGSSHPGGSFVKYKDFAGQTFYTLKG